jgi:hypothetical protein
MAINHSPNQYNRAIKIAYGKYYPLNGNNFLRKVCRFTLEKIFIFKWSIFNFKQSLIQSFYKKKINSSKINFILKKKIDLKKNSLELNDRGYTFIKNFFDENSYNYLLKNFPAFSNFKHIKKIKKNYFYCYKYNYMMNFKNIKNIEYNAEFKSFIKHLASKEFISDLENLLFQDKAKYKLKIFMCSYKNEGSFLIPHMDSVYNIADENSYNFIYFIDGKNEYTEFSAATGIYADNDFKQPLLVPDDLKNSCLVYKTSNTTKFFHGFDKVKYGGFAKVCTFQYVNENRE